ncbi:MAG: hypothetical protein EOP05_13505 [Proteobacteria bacterium]|nr:MAG: hypothetical protein EOP05_13505 [Pseudomonadota bacterium]
MSDSNQNHRRSFLKLGTLGLLGAVVAAKVGAPSTANAQAPAGDVKETDANAKALGYYEDQSKVDAKKFPKHKSDAAKNAHCYNCMFYMTKEADPSKTVKAPCSIFANKNVKAKAWCNTWALKPGQK